MKTLTDRQIEFLRLCMLPIPEIAKRLIVSESTVKTHINNIMKIFNVHTKGSAVIEGIRKGLISVWEVEVDKSERLIKDNQR